MYNTGWAKSRRALDCFYIFMAKILGGYWQILDRSGKKIILLSPLTTCLLDHLSCGVFLLCGTWCPVSDFVLLLWVLLFLSWVLCSLASICRRSPLMWSQVLAVCTVHVTVCWSILLWSLFPILHFFLFTFVSFDCLMLPDCVYCCNLSGGVALIVWFTTNGMCVKNKTIHIRGANKQ